MSAIRELLGLPSKAIVAERIRAAWSMPNPRPLFVFGNQKSGATAVAGLLAAGAGLRASLDLHGSRVPYFTQLLHGETSLDSFVEQNAYSFSAPIIKDANLTFIAGRVMERFKVERAVFVVRNPFDNIRSILDRLKVPGNLNSLEVHALKANRTWRAILSGEDLNLPPGHYVATLARRWLKAANCYDRLRTQLVAVLYDEFRANKRDVIGEVAQSFGLSATNDITPLLDHPFQRPGRPTCDFEGFFGQENLTRIEDICGPMAAQFVYRPAR